MIDSTHIGKTFFVRYPVLRYSDSLRNEKNNKLPSKFNDSFKEVKLLSISYDYKNAFIEYEAPSRFTTQTFLQYENIQTKHLIPSKEDCDLLLLAEKNEKPKKGDLVQFYLRDFSSREGKLTVSIVIKTNKDSVHVMTPSGFCFKDPTILVKNHDLIIISREEKSSNTKNVSKTGV